MFWHSRFRAPRFTTISLAGLWLAVILAPPAPGQSFSSTESVYKYHSIVPLGADKIRLRPSQQQIDLMATAESRGFEGMERRAPGHKVRLVNAKGSPVLYFPNEVSFRLTVSALDKLKDENWPLDVDTQQDLNSFLLGLHLRVRVFQGLDAYEIEPTNVEMLGMPANIPYEERIYRATFHLEHVPSEARLVLEVFDAKGERISRFHLDLY